MDTIFYENGIYRFDDPNIKFYIELFHQELKYKNIILTMHDNNAREIQFYKSKLQRSYELLKKIKDRS